MSDSLLGRIVLDPKIMVGKPVIRGTRVPVELLVRMLSQNIPEKEILREYPRLQPEDLRAALAYAAGVLASEQDAVSRGRIHRCLRRPVSAQPGH